MNTEILTLAGFGDTKLSATDAARSERDALLQQSAAVKFVGTPADAESATQVLRDLKAFTRLIEDARVTVKAPVRQLVERIDGLAKELTAALEAEYVRVGKVIGAFEAEQRRLRAEAEQRARDEERRIWQEARDKERAEQERIRVAQEEEAKKQRAIQEELAAKASRARTEAGRAKAEQEAQEARERAEREADAKKHEAELAEQARIEEAKLKMLTVRVEAVNAAPAKLAGAATREEPCYEITDIVALYESAPFLVNMTENKAALKSAIKNLQPGKNLPGVKHWFEHKTHVR